MQGDHEVHWRRRPKPTGLRPIRATRVHLPGGRRADLSACPERALRREYLVHALGRPLSDHQPAPRPDFVFFCPAFLPKVIKAYLLTYLLLITAKKPCQLAEFPYTSAYTKVYESVCPVGVGVHCDALPTTCRVSYSLGV